MASESKEKHVEQYSRSAEKRRGPLSVKNEFGFDNFFLSSSFHSLFQLSTFTVPFIVDNTRGYTCSVVPRVYRCPRARGNGGGGGVAKKRDTSVQLSCTREFTRMFEGVLPWKLPNFYARGSPFFFFFLHLAVRTNVRFWWFGERREMNYLSVLLEME